MRYPRYERVKQHLRALGCTHEELADAVGYSRPYVSLVLNGRVAPKCLDALEAQVRLWEAEERTRGGVRA